ncbi:hypothetical protein ARMSODRAFT_1089485 [Armillaria solidipes]|uniref:HNH nuclease domain-containing protein n=1 Tax=Armillaria solidipes TaxID=1076256 RepID=A0A2H3BFI5_9AGAR|nr:hypothetical protein ARMSODRAFT_1089485 [Armillaria solidipes]
MNGLNDNDTSAYNVYLEFDKSAPADSVPLIHASILGYLIIHSSGNARHKVVKVIHSCAQDHAKLFQLVQTFINYFIRPCNQEIQWRTPDSSDPPSPQLLDKLGHGIQEALETHKEAKDLALVRDGFRCVVTRIYDRTTVSEVSASPDEFREALYTTRATRSSTTASMLEVLKYGFGYDVEQLRGAKLHSLYNVMTMERNAYESFNRLEIWFEKKKVANCYKLRCIYSLYLWQTEVTFTTPDNENLSVLSQTLLALHAA